MNRAPKRSAASPTSLTTPLPLFHVLQPTSLEPGLPLVQGITESGLAGLARALGAETCGGPLSAAEREWIERGRRDTRTAEALAHIHCDILAGSDPLGTILCALRPAARRRLEGAFYTPPEIVSAMTGWLLSRYPDRIVDPGCGSGRFAAAAARLQPRVPIVAIDSDPLATLLARANLAVVGARDVHVVHDDYLTCALPPFTGRTGFVGNPPYVRHHDLPAATKAWAAAAGRRLGITVSGLSGLHALFFLATALKARQGDVGCFVTSSEWLDTRYGRAMRELLTGRLGVLSVTVVEPTAVPFEDAMTTAAITCFAVGQSATNVGFNVARAADSLDLSALGLTVPRSRLAQAERWSPLLRAEELPPRHAGPGVPLRAIARVHRGVATGNNGYFVLTRERAAQLGLLPWCRPAITRAEEILGARGAVRDEEARRVLLAVPRDVDRSQFPSLDAYLRLGEISRDGKPPVARGYLASHRTPWWYLGPPSAPPIVASYMARQAPAFAANPDGLVLLNIAHGIYPRQALGNDQIELLVAQLNNARTTYRGQGRTYHGGLEKFEPREMEELTVDLEEILGANVH